MRELTEDERIITELAIGRILRLGSRPEQPGDVEDYERYRQIVMDVCGDQPAPYTLNYVRDRLNGAAGD